MSRGDFSGFGYLEPMHQLCERWATTAFDWVQRQSNPIYRAMRQAEGAALPSEPPPMADDVLALDGVLADCKINVPRIYLFVILCYTKSGTSDTRATRLGMSRAAFYVRWKETLSYLTGRLHAKGIDLNRT